MAGANSESIMLKSGVAVCTMILACLLSENGVSSRAVHEAASTRFKNPITQEYPLGEVAVLLHSDGFYYFTIDFTSTAITIIKSPSLTSWDNSTRMTVFNVSAPLTYVYEPELHFIQGNWYIYFEGWVTGVSEGRSYVIKSTDPETPMAEYERPIKMSSYDADVWTRDGTVLQYDDGELYFIWTSAHNGGYRLYIAPMFSPTEISGSRVEIGSGGNTPQVLRRNGRTFIIFSGFSFTPASEGLAIMGLDYGRHPLVAENWWLKADAPVFWTNPAQSVYGLNYGHFATSPDRLESWVLYSARDVANATGATYSHRVERFDWDSTGLPVFPRPAGLALDHKLPSGATA